MSDRLSLSQVAALMAFAANTTGGKTPALRGGAMVHTPSGSPAFTLILYAPL